MIGLALLAVAAILAAFGILDLFTHAPSGTHNPSDDIWVRHEALGVPLGFWMLAVAALIGATGMVFTVRK